MIPKFRAFHDGEMRYIASKVGNALYWDDGDCFDLLAFKQEIPARLMQYTSLFDKNNVQICEYDMANVFGLDEPTPVVQHLGAFGYFMYNDFIPFAANHNFKWDANKSADIEVIGNIFDRGEDVWADNSSSVRDINDCIKSFRGVMIE
jgi:hypothetical protein